MRPAPLFLVLALAITLHAAPPADPASTAPAAAPASAPASPAQPKAPPKPKQGPARTPPADTGPELNIRTLGAVGDGQPHPVSEWVTAKKYKNLRDLQRDYPFVTSLDWSADEAAFQRALHDLPPTGGTVRIPAGKYIATSYGWRIDRDHIRLLGAGLRNTTLTTGPKLSEGLALAPYRHVGWQTGADKEYPFASDSGTTGSDKLRLREPARATDFQLGELVFVRNGACRFDQDYGEFNEIAGTTPQGDLILKHPLSRDYTLASLNWANETATELVLPPVGKTATVRVRTGEGFFELPTSGAITVGESLFEIVRREADTVELRNPGRFIPNGGEANDPTTHTNQQDGAATSHSWLRRLLWGKPHPTSNSATVPPRHEDSALSPSTSGDNPSVETTSSNSSTPSGNAPDLNAPPQPGTVLPAGTKIGKSRSVIKLTRTTRDFHATGLRVYGHRKALNLSNSYESTFLDCDFVRQPEATTPAGGLTIDGDGGRFAEFTRCTIRGNVPCGMQFARSFGNITFTGCTFAATNVVFSEFCFSGTLKDSSMSVPSVLGSALIVGRSCGDLQVTGNRIVVTGGDITIFDATSDIASQKHDAPGALVLRDNRVTAQAKPRLFLLRPDRPADITGNTLNGAPVDPPVAKPNP